MIETQRKRFISFVSELEHLATIRVPRWYFDVSSKPKLVDGFSDASQQAFAAVINLRSTYGDGRVEVQLVASKTKFAPTKREGIPRLELLERSS